jgi:hypothetical protein
LHVYQLQINQSSACCCGQLLVSLEKGISIAKTFSLNTVSSFSIPSTLIWQKEEEVSERRLAAKTGMAPRSRRACARGRNEAMLRRLNVQLQAEQRNFRPVAGEFWNIC